MKTTMIKPVMVMILAFGFFLLRPVPAAAHRVFVFGWVQGDTVHVEAKFSGGRRVNGGEITVTDSAGKQLLAGKTDARGEFAFKIPRKTALNIILNAGAGHRAEWKIPLKDIDPADLPAPAASAGKDADITAAKPSPAAASSAPTPGRMVSAEVLQQVVEKALDKKLAPVMRMLAEAQQQGPTARDVFGGIGYIFGLVGVAAYFHSRRKTPPR